MLKKINTTELRVSSLRYYGRFSLRGTESEDTVCLGDLGLGLQVPEDGVFAELIVSDDTYHQWQNTYLRVELVDLTREELVGLLGVGVVDKVVFDLLGLGCHLVVSVGSGQCLRSSTGEEVECRAWKCA